ncbi:hypothetical protein KUTeg_015675 [Tegillarca granosa]|uniref:thioredoxin-dependent peroxiredoxin n=1 Tax=Tegillarca granosa TaxID=220873 RepID=A0ABQ9ENC8_TEGGR|nr:hypothetical protein KUTeg_015675 [Tegillarca granosa]
MSSIGKKLPKFSLKNQDDKVITQTDLEGSYSVLYFYPKDDTPGCTKEACGFTENIKAFEKLGVKVYGVSPDDVASHKKFATKYKLKIELLADTEQKLCNALDVIGEKNMYGKIYRGVIRTTFIINPDGEIAEVYNNVRVDGHVDKVKEKITELIKL